MKEPISALLFVFLFVLTVAAIVMSARDSMQFARQLNRPASASNVRAQPTPAVKLNAAPTPTATGGLKKSSVRLSS